MTGFDTRISSATMYCSLARAMSAWTLLLMASWVLGTTLALLPDDHSSVGSDRREPWLEYDDRSRRELPADEGQTRADAFVAPGDQSSMAARGSVSSRSQQRSSRHLTARVVDAAPTCNASSIGQLWYARPGQELRVCDGLSWHCAQKETCQRLKSLEQGPTLTTGHTSSFLSFVTLAGKRNRTVQYLLLTQNHGDVVVTAGARGDGSGEVAADDVRDAKLLKVIPGDGVGGAAATTTVLRQTLSLGRVKVAKTVRARGRLYLAALSTQGLDLNGAPDGNAGVVTVLPWSGKRFRRRPHHELRAPRPGAVSMDTFVDADGDAYLVLVGTATGGQYGTWMTVYKWTSELTTGGVGREKFRVVFDRDYATVADPAQRIAADASHVRCFRVSGYQFVAVSVVYDGRTTSVDSHLFLVAIGCGHGDAAAAAGEGLRRSCVALHHRQRLATVGAMSVEFFSFPSGGVFLAFAGSVVTGNATGPAVALGAATARSSPSPPAAPSLDVFRAPSHVYRLDFRTQQFVEFQRLDTLACDTVRFFRVCNDVFLAVTSHLPDAVLRREREQQQQQHASAERTAIFRWRGIEKFRPWLSLPLTHRSWSLDVLDGDGGELGPRFLAESRVDGDGMPSSGLLELGRGYGGGACGSL